MVLDRAQYVASLSQLNINISGLEHQARAVQQALDQARLQKAVSELFIELNDNSEKSAVFPVSTFVHAINSSPNFYKLEAVGDIQLKVRRQGEKYTAESKCFFIEGELANLTKDATFDSEGWTIVTVPGYRASPAYLFAGAERETKVSIAEVAVGTHHIQVAQPSEPTVPIEPTPSVATA